MTADGLDPSVTPMIAQMNSQTNIPTNLLAISLDMIRGRLTSSVDEQGSSTESFNSVERDGGGADVDEGSDQRDEERVVDCSKTLEERGTEVENEVDT